MSVTTTPSRQGAVTVLVTRRVKPGHAQAFETAMRHMIAAAGEFPGHLGGHLIAPGSEASDVQGQSGQGGGAQGDVWHVIFAFDSAESLQRWQHSPARALGLAAVAPHTEGEQQVRQLNGLGYWFAEPKGPVQTPPPRWKVAVVTWLGICPTVFVLFLLLSEHLAGWPLLPRVMVLTALVVVLMTWVVAPRLTAWFRPWLHPAAKNLYQGTPA